MKRVTDEKLLSELLALENVEVTGRQSFNKIVINSGCGRCQQPVEEIEFSDNYRHAYMLDDIKGASILDLFDDSACAEFAYYAIIAVRDDTIYLLGSSYKPLLFLPPDDPRVWEVDASERDVFYGDDRQRRGREVFVVEKQTFDGTLNEQTVRDLRKIEVRGEQSFTAVVVEMGCKKLETGDEFFKVDWNKFTVRAMKWQEPAELSRMRHDGCHTADVRVLAVDGDKVYLLCGGKVYTLGAYDMLELEYKDGSDADIWGVTRVYTKNDDGPLYKPAEAPVTEAPEPPAAVERITAENVESLGRVEVRGEQSFDRIVVLSGFTGIGGSNQSGFSPQQHDSFTPEEISGKPAIVVRTNKEYRLPNVRILAVDGDTVWFKCGGLRSITAGEMFRYTTHSFIYDTAGMIHLFTEKDGTALRDEIIDKHE